MLKPITLVLCCLVVCCCSAAGCLNSTSNQTTSNNQNSGLQDSRVTLNVTSTAVGQPVSIPATITDGSGHPLDAKPIEWFLDGNSLGKSQSSSDGTTTLHLTSQYTGNLGNTTYHQLRVNFYGDDTYKSSTATSFLIVNATNSVVQNSTTRS